MHRRVARHLLSDSERAFAETRNCLQGSRTQWQSNFAVAVTVSSDTSEVKKSQKRVSKDERRSMVESFVNKYRAMNSGSFPTAKTVQKEVGGSYYVIREAVQELQHKSRIPSTSTMNDLTWDAELHKNADVNLGTTVKIKKSELATKEEDRSSSALEEKTLSDEIATMCTMTLETTVAIKKNKLATTEVDGPTSALDEKTSSDEIAQTTLGATVAVKKVELAAQEVDGPTSASEYKISEEIAKPSERDNTSAKTADHKYMIMEEARDFYSTTTISEDNAKEKTASKDDQQQQSSDLEKFTRELPEEHTKKPFTWNLKSLAEGFLRIWRKL